MHAPTSHDPRLEAATASLGQLRSRLLDLTARNPLISFPHGKAAGSRVYVRAVNGCVDALFAHLGDGKELTIQPLRARENGTADERGLRHATALNTAGLTDERRQHLLTGFDAHTPFETAQLDLEVVDAPRPQAGMPPGLDETSSSLAGLAQIQGINPDFDLAPRTAHPGAPDAKAKVEMQTLLLSELMNSQLAKMRDTGRTVAEETGVSTLHLAFGFLEWFESDTSEKPFTSPLILLRVDIDRKIIHSHYQYAVSAVGDDAEVNLTLSERLDRDFRIKLPERAEDEMPGAYLERVATEICKDRPRWSVRRFVTLAHFPFARLSTPRWKQSPGLRGLGRHCRHRPDRRQRPRFCSAVIRIGSEHFGHSPVGRGIKRC